MNRFLKWLGNRLFPGKAAADAPLRRTGARVSPAVTAHHRKPPAPTRPAQFAANVEGRIEDGGPGKNVLQRPKFVREDTGTHDTLKIIDGSVLETDEESGFDPYNTGRFDRSRSWDTRTRK